MTNAPYSYVVKQAMPGALTLIAKAITTNGVSFESKAVTVIVEARDVPQFLPPKIILENLLLLEFKIETRSLWLIERSTDIYQPREVVSGALSGSRLYIEPLSTNRPRFFYTMYQRS